MSSITLPTRAAPITLPQRAALITQHGRRLTEFPHVAYLKAKHEIWWACRIGKSDEFAHLLLTNGDVRLQRSLIRQQSKGRYASDIDRMYHWIQRFGLANDTDVQTAYNQVQLSPPQAQFSTSATTETTEERAAPTFSHARSQHHIRQRRTDHRSGVGGAIAIYWRGVFVGVRL